MPFKIGNTLWLTRQFNGRRVEIERVSFLTFQIL